MNLEDFGTTADLILHNAKVITLDPKQPRAEWVAIRKNRILAVGNKGDLSLLGGTRTKIIDCEHGTIIPGFNDAHCHPLFLAASLLSVDCSPGVVKNIFDIQASIRRQAKQTKENKWIRAAQYDEFYLYEKRPPNRWELDEATSRHPVILIHRTAQNCVLNSLALQLTGITKDTPQLPGGVIHKDPKTGEPNGLISGGNELVDRAVPPLDEEEVEHGMKLVNLKYLSYGITSLHDTTWSNGYRHWQFWQRLIDRGIISLRVSMLIGTESLKDFQRINLSTGCGNNQLRVGGMKLALDESTGSLYPLQKEINQLALQAHKAGFQVAFHVSDIYMLKASLTAIKFVCRRVPRTKHRFRLEHCAVCPQNLLPGLKDSEAIVVTQPSFLRCMGQKFQEGLLPHQISWLYPIASLQRMGVKVAFSSDSPLATSNPLTGIYAAVTRETETGQKLAPQENISIIEALKMYTLGGAYASLEERVKGTISAGKLADLAILNGDPTQTVIEELDKIKVIRTIVNGEVMWENSISIVN